MDNLRGTEFPDNELTHILNKRVRAEKVVIYLDGCHSGLSGLSERYARRGIGVYEVNEGISSLAAALSKSGSSGVVRFSASSSDGYSIEDAKWGGGAFTECLVKGLQGAANQDNDEWVTVSELETYLLREIVTLTEGKQQPKVNRTLGGETPLSRVK